VTVNILPLPESIITLLVIYDDIADAARSVSDIVSAGIIPTTLEMMDAPIIKAVEDSYACGYPRDAAAVLIIEVEGLSVGLKDQAAQISELCFKNNCRDIREAKDDSERNRLWEGRRGAFGAVARLAPNYLVNDCTVPRTKLPEALSQVAAIVKKYNFEHGNVFHAGDGNLHPLIFFDSRDADQLKRVKKAGWEIMVACVELGGTISGEHGVGLEKIDAMRLIFSEQDFAVQRALQQAFSSPPARQKKLPPVRNPERSFLPQQPLLRPKLKLSKKLSTRFQTEKGSWPPGAAHCVTLGTCPTAIVNF
jgi:FAD/FMN-containing dehydrogenase